MKVPAVILAGGLSRRMGGGDKALMLLAGRPLIGHVADRLCRQCAPLAINANGDPARFADFGPPVIADGVAGHPGPLAGILAAMDWAAQLGAPQVLTAPADTPDLPEDLLLRLLEPGGPAHAADADGRAHPTVGLWPVAAAADLRAALTGGMRRVQDWTTAINAREVAFADPGGFRNINTPADLAQAEAAYAGRVQSASPMPSPRRIR